MLMYIKLKEWIKNNRLLKPLYYRYIYIRSRIVNAKSYHLLQEQGSQVLFFIQRLLEGKVLFYFDAGTLLGIIREGRFLKHDNDIDVAVLVNRKEEIERVREIFLSAGCKMIRSFLVDEIGIVEEVFSIWDFKFDVFFIQKGEERDYCYAMYRGSELAADPDIDKMSVVKLYFTPVECVTKTEFNGMHINVPKDAERYLEERYGTNWRIPNKYFKFWEGPNAEKTNLVGTCVNYREKK